MADQPSQPDPPRKPKLVARSMRNDPGRSTPAAPPPKTEAAKPVASEPQTPSTPEPREPTDSTDRVPLSSTMFAAIHMPDGQARDAVLAAFDAPGSALRPFASRYRVIGSKRTDGAEGEPAVFRVYLNAAAAERAVDEADDPDEIGHALLTELVRTTRVRMANSEYVSVVLPLKDRDNPRSVSLNAANQWRYWDRAEAEPAPVSAPTTPDPEPAPEPVPEPGRPPAPEPKIKPKVRSLRGNA